MDTSLRPIGHVVSELGIRAHAPRQPDEGAPPARLRLRPDLAPAVVGLRPDDRIVVVTWLHEADRGVLQVHPRDDPTTALTGVFATRSPDRPNPIGLHTSTVVAVTGTDIEVRALEAIDGTPILDVTIAL